MDYARSGNEATSDVTIDAGTQKNKENWKYFLLTININIMKGVCHRGLK